MRTTLSFSALILATALHAPPAWAGGAPPDLAEKLGLTADQAAQVESIDYAAQSARIPVQARLEAARLDARHDLMAATLDEAAIHKAVDAANAAEAELHTNRVDQLIALHKVLTAEQWAKAGALWHDDDGDEAGEHGHDDRPGAPPAPPAAPTADCGAAPVAKKKAHHAETPADEAGDTDDTRWRDDQ